MTDTDQNEDLFLVDGSGFIFRAYHALPPMNRPDGTPVNAVLGFTNILVKLITDMKVKNIAVIWDAKRKNFRNDIYPAYKANRSETPEDLVPQFPIIHESVDAFGLPSVKIEGFEADDIIATYARLAHEQGKKVTIVSSDKDLMQLIRPGVRMYDAMKYKYMGEEETFEKFGVLPNKVVDVQSLAGDSVDNVPGVPGIGVKIAAELINRFGDLDTLLERSGEVTQNKRRENLIEFADQARISRELVRLDAHVDVPMTIDELNVPDANHETLLEFLKTQGFNSTIARLERVFANSGFTSPPSSTSTNSSNNNETSAPVTAEYELIQDTEQLKKWVTMATEAGIVAVDTETNSLTPAKADLIGVSMSTAKGNGCYLPLGHKDTVQINDSFDFGDAPVTNIEETSNLKQIPMDQAMAILKPMLEDPSVLKVGQNIKYDLQLLYKYDIFIDPIDDTMLMSYVLDGTAHKHGMDELAQLFLGVTPIKFSDVCGKGKKQITFDLVPLDKALTYAAEDTDITLQLYNLFKPRLAQERMMNVYETLERPLSSAIAIMEYNGIKIDPSILKKMSDKFGKKLRELEDKIHEIADINFNIASPKQLSEVLFEKMELPHGKKTKTGAYSTSVGVLEKLANEGHEIVQLILEFRHLSKLKSTYTDALPEAINPKTGRLHTSFHMAGTSTGRLSSSDPNLQNIPIRNENGRAIRTAFVPESGYKLLAADYSQVELRLAAELADIKALKQAFSDGVDVHSLTASQVFGIPMDEMTPEIRRRAKAINFGIIYGISGFGLSKQLDIPIGEASEYIKKYMERFPELSMFMEAAKDEARQHGYVKTFYGRKCVIRGINDKNKAMQQFGERQAINAPLQGTAADIMKRAMIAVVPALKKAGLNAKMLLQVHDELIFEVPEAEMEETRQLVIDVMEAAGSGIEIPLVVDANYGENWAEAH